MFLSLQASDGSLRGQIVAAVVIGVPKVKMKKSCVFTS
jgi:hypothetical protein